ncbi:MAG: hypothetical protein ACRD0D_09240, partial [Acidimicrobiales bacterium]
MIIVEGSRRRACGSAIGDAGPGLKVDGQHAAVAGGDVHLYEGAEGAERGLGSVFHPFPQAKFQQHASREGGDGPRDPSVFCRLDVLVDPAVLLCSASELVEQHCL